MSKTDSNITVRLYDYGGNIHLNRTEFYQEVCTLIILPYPGKEAVGPTGGHAGNFEEGISLDSTIQPNMVIVDVLESSD